MSRFLRTCWSWMTFISKIEKVRHLNGVWCCALSPLTSSAAALFKQPFVDLCTSAEQQQHPGIDEDPIIHWSIRWAKGHLDMSYLYWSHLTGAFPSVWKQNISLNQIWAHLRAVRMDEWCWTESRVVDCFSLFACNHSHKASIQFHSSDVQVPLFEQRERWTTSESHF